MTSLPDLTGPKQTLTPTIALPPFPCHLSSQPRATSFFHLLWPKPCKRKHPHTLCLIQHRSCLQNVAGNAAHPVPERHHLSEGRDALTLVPPSCPSTQQPEPHSDSESSRGRHDFQSQGHSLHAGCGGPVRSGPGLLLQFPLSPALPTQLDPLQPQWLLRSSSNVPYSGPLHMRFLCLGCSLLFPPPSPPRSPSRRGFPTPWVPPPQAYLTTYLQFGSFFWNAEPVALLCLQ